MNQKNQLVIKNTATGKNTLLLGLLFLTMACFVMPEAKKQIGVYGQGIGVIDGKFCCSPDLVYSMIEGYSEKGRQLYLAVELSADLFYSIVIALFLCSFMVWTTLISKNNYLKIKHLLWIAGLYFLANCLENAGIVRMLSDYPEKHFYLSLATSFFSFSKIILTLVCLFVTGWNLAFYSYIKFDIGLKLNKENPVSDKN